MQASSYVEVDGLGAAAKDRYKREEVNPPMWKIARDLMIVAGGHVLAYVVIFWTFPIAAHLTG
ncbi:MULTISPECIES: hypothetical protein [Streptomyces]|uniref:Uncharacterized protein n=1 Tax=Streptomyces galilaeus TaxID=33899 RepID=A0ABW9IKX1_STRGJ